MVTVALDVLGAEFGHAAARWARAAAGILGAPTDPTTVEAWGRGIGVSSGALRGWCRAAGVRAKPSLDFARMLRAVVQARERGWDPQNVLDVVDDRTLRRLLVLSGFTAPVHTAWRPTAEHFLEAQRFVREPMNLRAVIALLCRQGVVSRGWAGARLESEGQVVRQQPVLASKWFTVASAVEGTPGETRFDDS